MLEIGLPRKRKVVRPKIWFMDTIKERMREVGVTEEEVRNIRNWRRKILCGDP